MARKLSSSNAIEDLASCAVCLEHFTDPRALECMHSYCAHCLQGLVSPQNKLVCPECRAVYEVPNGDVKSLKKNFHLSNLVENLRLNNNEGEEETSDACCPEHPSRSLELYCEDCCRMICYQCAVMDGNCHRHRYKDAGKMVDEFREELNRLSQTGQKNLASMEELISSVEDIKTKEVAKFNEFCDTVEENHRANIKKLTTRKEDNLRMAQRNYDENLRVCSTELQRVNTKYLQIKGAKALCDKTLAIKNDTQFMQKYQEHKTLLLMAITPMFQTHCFSYEEKDIGPSTSNTHLEAVARDEQKTDILQEGESVATTIPLATTIPSTVGTTMPAVSAVSKRPRAPPPIPPKPAVPRRPQV